MILDALIFALGFLVAGLLALAVLPAVWRRALRLSEERLSRLVPLSPEEIAAERDHLRAAHAVELRRLEQRLDVSEGDRTALRVEAARRETRILTLDDEGVRAQVMIASLEAEVAALRREVAGLWAESGAESIALDGLSRLAETRLADIAALQADRAALRAERAALETERDRLAHEVDRSRGSVAGLETRLVGVDTRNEDLERDLAQARREVTAAAERIAAAAAERDATPPAPPPQEDLGRRLEMRVHEIESLKIELAFMSEQAASAERRATETSRAYEALQASRRSGAMPPAGDEDTRLRAAIAALADEVMRVRDRTSAST